jgi:dephospho-CoA kinase
VDDLDFLLAEDSKMRWIGLTGGLGSGKSTVSQILRRLGVPVVDADAVARSLTDKGGAAVEAVAQAFGKDLLLADGSIDKKSLASQVFGHPEKLAKLEGLLHPLVRAEVAKQRQSLKSQGAKYAVYDVPLLFEKSMQKDFDLIVVVNCSLAEQKERVRKRNGWSMDEIDRRLAAQLPLKEKATRADLVIQNSGTMKDLEVQVQRLKNELEQGQV